MPQLRVQGRKLRGVHPERSRQGGQFKGLIDWDRVELQRGIGLRKVEAVFFGIVDD